MKYSIPSLCDPVGDLLVVASDVAEVFEVTNQTLDQTEFYTYSTFSTHVRLINYVMAESLFALLLCLDVKLQQNVIINK